MYGVIKLSNVQDLKNVLCEYSTEMQIVHHNPSKHATIGITFRISILT